MHLVSSGFEGEVLGIDPPKGPVDWALEVDYPGWHKDPVTMSELKLVPNRAVKLV